MDTDDLLQMSAAFVVTNYPTSWHATFSGNPDVVSHLVFNVYQILHSLTIWLSHKGLTFIRNWWPCHSFLIFFFFRKERLHQTLENKLHITHLLVHPLLCTQLHLFPGNTESQDTPSWLKSVIPTFIHTKGSSQLAGKQSGATLHYSGVARGLRSTGAFQYSLQD